LSIITFSLSSNLYFNSLTNFGIGSIIKSFGLNLFQPDSFREYEFLSNLNLQIGNNGVVYSGYINSFQPVTTGLIGIMSGDNFDNDSRLMRFAAQNIRENKQGPVLARITQNLTSATLGRVRLADALNGNLATAINIATGREPLVEKNYKITVAKTLAGKGIDFLQTVAGVEFPFSEIPGDYLSNPQNPIENRPEPRTQAGAILQDITGALGSLIGIQNRIGSFFLPCMLLITGQNLYHSRFLLSSKKINQILYINFFTNFRITTIRFLFR
jgi:hypothetical protein